MTAMLEVTVLELAGMSNYDLGSSEWMVVKQDRIDTFADATDDWQWIHVDPDQAVQGPFGATVAHGYLTLSLVPKLLDMILLVTDQVRGTNYGIDALRFTNPVTVNSWIRISAVLKDVDLRADGGLKYSVEAQVEIKDQPRLAMIGTFVYLTYGS